MLRSLRILMVSLGVLGFMLQSLAGGGRGAVAGQALCVGCERSWWTVSPPCDPASAIDCCDEDENGGDTPVLPGHQPLAHGQNECGCIDVPLPGHARTAVVTARIDLAGKLSVHQPVAVMSPPWSWEVPATITSWARAGPRSPPRQLLPLSRCTVLVI
jgi:hypothetical protein